MFSEIFAESVFAWPNVKIHFCMLNLKITNVSIEKLSSQGR